MDLTISPFLSSKLYVLNIHGPRPCKVSVVGDESFAIVIFNQAGYDVRPLLGGKR